MTIDPAQLSSLATVTIGTDPANPLYADDSLRAVYIVAEGIDGNGDPINPAPFGTDRGGWLAEIEMEPDSNLSPTVENPLADDGQIVIVLAVGESLGKAGKHRGTVRIYNPDPGPRNFQRTVFDFVISITEEKDP